MRRDEGGRVCGMQKERRGYCESMRVDVYKKYSREDALCQTNGYFSLNLRKSSVPEIVRLLELREGDTVGWIGCGDARELLEVAQQFPLVRFRGIDHNETAIRIARRVLSQIGLHNVRLDCLNALDDFATYSHVFSTAIYGDELNRHLHRICTKRLCLLASMWIVAPEDFEAATVRLSGSGEQRQLIAGRVTHEAALD